MTTLPETNRPGGSSPAGNPFIERIVGTLVSLHRPAGRDQRGLSQSTENAVLLTGAVGIALAVITIVGRYVAARLGELG